MAVHVNGQVTVALAQFRDGVSRRAGPSIQHPLPLELVPYTEALSQIGSGEQGLYGDRLELLGGGQHLGI
jgi:hypothetical protein